MNLWFWFIFLFILASQASLLESYKMNLTFFSSLFSIFRESDKSKVFVFQKPLSVFPKAVLFLISKIEPHRSLFWKYYFKFCTQNLNFNNEIH